MTDVLGLVAYLLLPVIGLVTWRLDFVRTMPLPARLAVALAAGALTIGLLLSALSLIGIEWSRTVLYPILAILVAIGVLSARNTPPVPRNPQHATRAFALIATAVCWLLALYGTLTARVSCGDLQFTWGPKAVRFFRAGGLDPAVLHTWPLTPDYPPLQTLLLAFSNMLPHQFPWWAAILAFPLFFLATLAIIRTWSGDDIGTLLVAATLAYAFTLSYPAGCAEPPLLLFETIAIAALVFVDHPRAQTFLVALGLAGAVFTKLEGTTFAIAVFLTILLVQRNGKRAFIVIAPAALLFVAWMTFVLRNDLLTMYGGARMPIYWSVLPVVLKTLAKVAKFDLYWLPYLVPIVLIAIGNWRRAMMPVTIAVLTSCATVYFYIHYSDPIWWIESSSPRVILTPLLALLIGAVAAHAPSSSGLQPCARVARHGLVPEGEETQGSGRPPDPHSGGPVDQV